MLGLCSSSLSASLTGSYPQPPSSTATQSSPSSLISSPLVDSKAVSMTKRASPSGAPTPDCKKLFVGGLHLDTNEGKRQAGARLLLACTSLYPAVSLANYFKRFGEVYAAEIMLNHSTHKSRGTRTSRGVRWSREGPRAGCPAYPPRKPCTVWLRLVQRHRQRAARHSGRPASGAWSVMLAMEQGSATRDAALPR